MDKTHLGKLKGRLTDRLGVTESECTHRGETRRGQPPLFCPSIFEIGKSVKLESSIRTRDGFPQPSFLSEMSGKSTQHTRFGKGRGDAARVIDMVSLN